MKKNSCINFLVCPIIYVLVLVSACPAETKVNLRPYLLLGQAQGDLNTEGITADFDLGWGNALEKGNGAIGLDLDIRKEEYNILSQVWYTALSDSQAGLNLASYNAAQQDYDALFITEAVGLSLYKEGANWLDFNIGARFASVSNTLSIRTGSGESELSSSNTWIDPIVGFAASIKKTEDISFSLAGDYGGFGVNSDSTWQGYAAVNFALTRRGAFSLGYRAMMHDYLRDDFSYKILAHGPTLGFLFSF